MPNNGPRDFTLGKVNIVFENRKQSGEIQGDPWYNSDDRLVRIEGNEIIIPNFPKVQVIPFRGTNECFVVSRSYLNFGNESHHCYWCGDRNGKAFAFPFTRNNANIANDGSMENFLSKLKPWRTKALESQDNKAYLNGPFWYVKYPNQNHFTNETLELLRFCFPSSKFKKDSLKLLSQEIKGEIWTPGNSGIWWIGKNIAIRNPYSSQKKVEGYYLITWANF